MKLTRTSQAFFVSIFTAVLLAVGFGTGYFFSTRTSNEAAKKLANKISEENKYKEKETEDVVNNKVVPSVIPKQDVIVYDEDQIKDLEVEYIDRYTVCGHENSNTTNVYGISIREFKDMIKEDVTKRDYKLIEEKENKLTYIKDMEQYCSDHYLVKIENGIVVIYNIVNEGVCSKYKDTIIKEDIIRESLKKELKTGIRVDTREELYSLLEDIES